MMSGEEFCTLAQYVNGAAAESPAHPVNRVIGIHDLAAAIGCCDSTVYMLKRLGCIGSDNNLPYRKEDSL